METRRSCKVFWRMFCPNMPTEKRKFVEMSSLSLFTLHLSLFTFHLYEVIRLWRRTS